MGRRAGLRPVGAAHAAQRSKRLSCPPLTLLRCVRGSDRPRSSKVFAGGGFAMATVARDEAGLLNGLGRLTTDFLTALGDLSLFAGRVLSWAARRPGRGTLLPVFFAVGGRSLPVVTVTGMFIGMVLAVQAYGQFASLGMATRLGAIVSISVVRELGPVLAATMLAGRVGGAMAAELATMRITEQID